MWFVEARLLKPQNVFLKIILWTYMDASKFMYVDYTTEWGSDRA